MDFRDPKNQILLIIIVGFIALVYVWHAKFYTPYSAQLTQKKAQYEKLRSDLFAVKQKAKSLEALQEEYDVLLAKYEKVKLWLPEQKEDESFLAQLHIASQLTNSTVMNVAPSSPVSYEFYSANPYDVVIESTYHDLGRFFARVVNFPFIVNISNIHLETKEGLSSMMDKGNKKRSDLTMTASFTLTAYNSHKGGQTQ